MTITKESSAKVPADLHKALAASAKAKAQWSDLTPIARRDFIRWVVSAKQAETRTRRVGRTCDMLLKGKRRPCCYSIMPMNMYKALGANKKAKAQWSSLTPDERRDFVAWIDSAEESEAHKSRIEKACAMLVSGKRHP